MIKWLKKILGGKKEPIALFKHEVVKPPYPPKLYIEADGGILYEDCTGLYHVTGYRDITESWPEVKEQNATLFELLGEKIKHIE